MSSGNRGELKPATLSWVRAAMRGSSMAPQRQLGQNFLVDPNIVRNIIDRSGVSTDDSVIEVGAGLGALTYYLAKSTAQVVAVEKDSGFEPHLQTMAASLSNVRILMGDFLNTTYDEIVSGTDCQGETGSGWWLFGNLPYYITTPILLKVIEEEWPLAAIVIMVQKEVAVRMEASPGSKDYGSLTLALESYGQASILFEVSRRCFYPQPKVDSAVVRIERKPRDFPCSRQKVFGLIRGAFKYRRKTLPNALAQAGYDKKRVVGILERLDIDRRTRPEGLELDDFIEIALQIERGGEHCVD